MKAKQLTRKQQKSIDVYVELVKSGRTSKEAKLETEQIMKDFK